jgi:hypothetical protein
MVKRQWDCPLARFLGPGWCVDGESAKGPDDHGRPLPEWAHRFVAQVDALPVFGGEPPLKSRRVSPRLALELLDAVETDMEAEARFVEWQASRARPA